MDRERNRLARALFGDRGSAGGAEPGDRDLVDLVARASGSDPSELRELLRDAELLELERRVERLEEAIAYLLGLGADLEPLPYLIRHRREALGMSRNDLADLCGTSPQNIWLIEMGRVKHTRAMLPFNLARALGTVTMQIVNAMRLEQERHHREGPLPLEKEKDE